MSYISKINFHRNRGDLELEYEITKVKGEKTDTTKVVLEDGYVFISREGYNKKEERPYYNYGRANISKLTKALKSDDVPDSERTLNEIVYRFMKQKLRLDLDIKDKEVPAKFSEEMFENAKKDKYLNTIVTAIMTTFKKLYKKKLEVDNIKCFTSSRKGKVSYHFIIQGYYVEDSFQAREFASKVADSFNTSTDKYVRQLGAAVDMSIYDNGHNLRMIYCVKDSMLRGKDELVRLTPKEFKYLNKKISSKSTVKQSIITYIEDDDELLESLELTQKRNDPKSLFLDSEDQQKAIALFKEYLKKVLKTDELAFTPLKDYNNGILWLTREEETKCEDCDRIHDGASKNNSTYLYINLKGNVYVRCKKFIDENKPVKYYGTWIGNIRHISEEKIRETTILSKSKDVFKLQKAQEIGSKSLDDLVIYLNNYIAYVAAESPVIIIKRINDHGQVEYARYTEANFKSVWRHYDFTYIDIQVNKKNVETKREITANLAEWWLKNPNRLQFDGFTFEPCPYGDEGTLLKKFNLWTGFTIDDVPAAPDLYDLDPLLDHVYNCYARCNDELYIYFMKYFARMIQFPYQKLGTSIFLLGEEGIGKTLFVNMILKILGPHGKLFNNAQVFGQFNSELKDCLLAFFDECTFGGDKDLADHIKGLVTQDMILINEKNKAPYSVPCYTNAIFATNKEYAIDTGNKARRWVIFECDNEYAGISSAEKTKYFKKLRDINLSTFFWLLLHINVTDFNSREFPVTDSLREHKIKSFNSIVHFWFKVLCDEPKWFVNDNNEQKQEEKKSIKSVKKIVIEADKMDIDENDEKSIDGKDKKTAQKITKELIYGMYTRFVEDGSGNIKKKRVYDDRSFWKTTKTIFKDGYVEIQKPRRVTFSSLNECKAMFRKYVDDPGWKFDELEEEVDNNKDNKGKKRPNLELYSEKRKPMYPIEGIDD